MQPILRMIIESVIASSFGCQIPTVDDSRQAARYVDFNAAEMQKTNPPHVKLKLWRRKPDFLVSRESERCDWLDGANTNCKLDVNGCQFGSISCTLPLFIVG